MRIIDCSADVCSSDLSWLVTPRRLSRARSWTHICAIPRWGTITFRRHSHRNFETGSWRSGRCFTAHMELSAETQMESRDSWQPTDRKSDVLGMAVAVRVDLGGASIIKKKNAYN